ncbi:MAG: PqqD family protein [Eubacteriales bacterium]
MHSSCISYNGQAVLFTAPSGTGKSTQADIWKSYLGAKVINGDRPFLHIIRDEVRAYGVPWDGKEQIFLQENYPVSAVIEVRQAKKNIIRKLTEKQAFKLMMKQCFIPMWDDAAKFAIMETIRRISKKISFYRLFCLPDENAATLLHNVLFENKYFVLKKERPDMKIKEGFIIKNIIDEWIVMPAGSNIKKFEGAIILNSVSAFIWKQLEKSICYDDLLRFVLDEYNIDEQTAVTDINNFVNKLRKLEILQEE